VRGWSDGDSEYASGLAVAGQVEPLYIPNLELREDRVAVLAALVVEAAVEDGLHVEEVGEFDGLVDTPGADRAPVNLLEADDVRIN